VEALQSKLSVEVQNRQVALDDAKRLFDTLRAKRDVAAAASTSNAEEASKHERDVRAAKQRWETLLIEAGEREEKLARLGQHWVGRREQREEAQRCVETLQAKEQRVVATRKEAQKKVASLVAQDRDTQRTFFVKMEAYLRDAMAVLDVMLLPGASEKDVPRLGALRERAFSCNKELVEEQTQVFLPVILPYPLSFIPYPSSLMPHSLSLIPHPFIPYPFIPSSLIPYPFIP
jgi:hypothetical protein